MKLPDKPINIQELVPPLKRAYPLNLWMESGRYGSYIPFFKMDDEPFKDELNLGEPSWDMLTEDYILMPITFYGWTKDAYVVVYLPIPIVRDLIMTGKLPNFNIAPGRLRCAYNINYPIATSSYTLNNQIKGLARPRLGYTQGSIPLNTMNNDKANIITTSMSELLNHAQLQNPVKNAYNLWHNEGIKDKGCYTKDQYPTDFAILERIYYLCMRRLCCFANPSIANAKSAGYVYSNEDYSLSLDIILNYAVLIYHCQLTNVSNGSIYDFFGINGNGYPLVNLSNISHGISSSICLGPNYPQRAVIQCGGAYSCSRDDWSGTMYLESGDTKITLPTSPYFQDSVPDLPTNFYNNTKINKDAPFIRKDSKKEESVETALNFTSNLQISENNKSNVASKFDVDKRVSSVNKFLITKTKPKGVDNVI